MTDIDTLEEIIYDFIRQNQITVGEMVALLETVKFRILYSSEIINEDDNDDK